MLKTQPSKFCLNASEAQYSLLSLSLTQTMFSCLEIQRFSTELNSKWNQKEYAAKEVAILALHSLF